MLAWRAVARRPAFIIWQAQACRTRRQLHVSLPRAQVQQPRGPGLYARLRFRKDGTLRSQLMGAFVGFSVLLNLVLLSSFVELVEATEEEFQYSSGGMFFLLRADEDYDNVDLNDPVATLNYFKRMVKACVSIPESNDIIETFLDKVFDTLRAKGEMDPEKRIHEVLRTAVEKVHHILRKIDTKGDSFFNGARDILDIFDCVFATLAEIAHDPEDAEDSFVKPTLDYIRDHSEKDPEAATKDYDSLG